jgi:hypothetical protein
MSILSLAIPALNFALLIGAFVLTVLTFQPARLAASFSRHLSRVPACRAAPIDRHAVQSAFRSASAPSFCGCWRRFRGRRLLLSTREGLLKRVKFTAQGGNLVG